jgi:hypothetical protein
MARRIETRGKRPAAARETDTEKPVAVMFTLPPGQRDALQAAAALLRRQRGVRGRANASEVLRLLLRDWIAGGAKLPAVPEHE